MSRRRTKHAETVQRLSASEGNVHQMSTIKGKLHLEPVLANKTIDWDLIRQQYDQIVKYTTVLRLGKAEAE
ncbi:hypothetical protein AQI88_42055 [Streptomyces cellostaticus]|uniref:Tn3 transposase DDE domain-containing protein n=1 Tax=Streptomyces cellostaticus TaxID=67285 RepID=A0A101N021_9ACTN|nr:hypothetical protein AQI88_42055 [Streptomyces cellostaticus]